MHPCQTCHLIFTSCGGTGGCRGKIFGNSARRWSLGQVNHDAVQPKKQISDNKLQKRRFYMVLHGFIWVSWGGACWILRVFGILRSLRKWGCERFNILWLCLLYPKKNYEKTHRTSNLGWCKTRVIKSNKKWRKHHGNTFQKLRTTSLDVNSLKVATGLAVVLLDHAFWIKQQIEWTSLGPYKNYQ